MIRFIRPLVLPCRWGLRMAICQKTAPRKAEISSANNRRQFKRMMRCDRIRNRPAVYRKTASSHSKICEMERERGELCPFHSSCSQFLLRRRWEGPHQGRKVDLACEEQGLRVLCDLLFQFGGRVVFREKSLKIGGRFPIQSLRNQVARPKVRARSFRLAGSRTRSRRGVADD